MAKDKHLPHWPEVPPGMLSSATASYVEHVAALDGGMTMAEVANVLAENTDAEFPVVSSADAESSTFIGFTTRLSVETLVEVNQAQGDQQAPLRKYMDNGQLPISYTAPRIPVRSTLNQLCTMFALYHAKRVYVTNHNALVGIVNSEVRFCMGVSYTASPVCLAPRACVQLTHPPLQVLHERLSGSGIAKGAAPSVAGRVHGAAGVEDRVSITLDGAAEASSNGTELVHTGNGTSLASQQML